MPTGPPKPGNSPSYPSFGIGCLGSVEHSFLLLEAFLPESAALSPPVFWPIALTVVPATNPDRAAPMSSARIDFVMCTTPFLVFFTLYEGSLDWSLKQQQATRDSRRGKAEPQLSLLLTFNGLTNVQRVHCGIWTCAKY